MKGIRHVPAHDATLVYGRTLWARSALREFFLEKDVVRVVQTAPPPPAPPKGVERYINSVLKTSMVRPRWGATRNSGRELTRECYALQQKYHLPCPPPPPPLQFFCTNIHYLKVISATRQFF